VLHSGKRIFFKKKQISSPGVALEEEGFFWKKGQTLRTASILPECWDDTRGRLPWVCDFWHSEDLFPVKDIPGSSSPSVFFLPRVHLALGEACVSRSAVWMCDFSLFLLVKTQADIGYVYDAIKYITTYHRVEMSWESKILTKIAETNTKIICDMTFSRKSSHEYGVTKIPFLGE
jgi:hypothetical protein